MIALGTVTVKCGGESSLLRACLVKTLSPCTAVVGVIFVARGIRSTKSQLALEWPCSSGWPRTRAPAYTTPLLRFRSHITMPGLGGAENQTSGFKPARLDMYPLSYLPCAFEISFFIFSDQGSKQFEECRYLIIPTSTTIYVHLYMSVYVCVYFYI